MTLQDKVMEEVMDVTMEYTGEDYCCDSCNDILNTKGKHQVLSPSTNGRSITLLLISSTELCNI
jgi:hypothetical protein